MSEFLRRHLKRLKKMREEVPRKEFVLEFFDELIADVEAHQHVITLKKRPKYDFPKAKEIARAQGIQLMPKEGYIDKIDMEEQFRVKGIEIPTIPSIYDKKNPRQLTWAELEEEADE